MKNWNQHAMEHHPENFVRVMALVPQKTKECIQTETTNKTMERLKKQKTEEQDPEWTTEDTKKKRKRPRNKKPTNGATKRKTN